MQQLLLAVDRLSTWLGQLFSWLIVILTALITYVSIVPGTKDPTPVPDRMRRALGTVPA